jgi:hypothetical protein
MTFRAYAGDLAALITASLPSWHSAALPVDTVSDLLDCRLEVGTRNFHQGT